MSRKLIGGKDIPFRPLPEGYSYRCFQCNYEMAGNKAFIDVEIGIAEF